VISNSISLTSGLPLVLLLPWNETDALPCVSQRIHPLPPDTVRFTDAVPRPLLHHLEAGSSLNHFKKENSHDEKA
jgi:hypothetical protein